MLFFNEDYIIMKFNKNEAKTLNSQKSDIDIFTKLQNNFLQKFFQYTLVDTNEDKIYNLYDNYDNFKLLDKSMKAIAQELFCLKRQLNIPEIIQNIRQFSYQKSPSFSGGELTHLLQPKYLNIPEGNMRLHEGELLYLNVKIKIDNQRIQELPDKMKQALNSIEQRLASGCPIANLLRKYKKQQITFMIVYYGECNFHLIKKDQYQQREMKLFGRTIKLRIHVYFVSKIGLFQSFKTMSKVPHLEYINDLIIQFYERKRQKMRRKKVKKVEAQELINRSGKFSSSSAFSLFNMFGIKTALGIAAVVGAAFAFGKLLK